MVGPLADRRGRGRLRGFHQLGTQACRFQDARRPLDWENVSLIDGDLDDFVHDLKASEGGEIAVVGGISIVRHLFFAGLLDSLTLMTHPVVAGSSRKMFEPGDPLTELELRSLRSTSKGSTFKGSTSKGSTSKGNAILEYARS